jgi:uncharacterized membrane protein YdfJ with MMPL/SSD domain
MERSTKINSAALITLIIMTMVIYLIEQGHWAPITVRGTIIALTIAKFSIIYLLFMETIHAHRFWLFLGPIFITTLALTLWII